MSPRSYADVRRLARARLPRFLFDYIDGGALSETTLSANTADLRSVRLRQRVLRDVSAMDPSVEVLGRRWAFPLALAPVGLAGLNARRGEVQAARAAEAAGVPFCLSTVSVCTLEEVARGVERPFWFQLYMIRDRAFMGRLIDRARDVGCDTLVFTVDMPTPGVRHGDYRSGLADAPGLGGRARRLGQALARPGWCWDVGLRGRPLGLGHIAEALAGRSGLEDFFGWMRESFDPTISWDDLSWVRDRWPGALVVKGILDPEDALACLAAGADGIVVSNHGGRQLDGAPSTASVLPGIAQAVAGRLTVLVDGGVRDGADIARCLTLGAQAVLVGRPWVYALASGGQAGVARSLAIFEAEFRSTLALMGLPRAATLSHRKAGLGSVSRAKMTENDRNRL